MRLFLIALLLVAPAPDAGHEGLGVVVDGGPVDPGTESTDATQAHPVDGGASCAAADCATTPPTCSSAAAECAPCALATSTGPGYPAGVCAAIVACVQAGDAGAYPVQTCHNLAGGGTDWGGLACVNALLHRDCPGLL